MWNEEHFLQSDSRCPRVSPTTTYGNNNQLYEHRTKHTHLQHKQTNTDTHTHTHKQQKSRLTNLLPITTEERETVPTLHTQPAPTHQQSVPPTPCLPSLLLHFRPRKAKNTN